MLPLLFGYGAAVHGCTRGSNITITRRPQCTVAPCCCCSCCAAPLKSALRLCPSVSVAPSPFPVQSPSPFVRFCASVSVSPVPYVPRVSLQQACANTSAGRRRFHARGRCRAITRRCDERKLSRCVFARAGCSGSRRDAQTH